MINRLTRISQNAFQSLKHQKIKCRCFRTLKQYSLFIPSHTNLFRCSNIRNHKFKSKLSFKIVNQASDLIRSLPASQLEMNRIKGFPTFFVCLKWKLSKRLKVLMRLLQRHNKMLTIESKKRRSSLKSQVRRKNKKIKMKITWILKFYKITWTKSRSLSLPKGPLSLIQGNRLLKSSMKTKIKSRLIWCQKLTIKY